ncbi:Rab-GTPase-TBC domain containing protein [Nitzschia inconspicua]|uniref:Rab-GTPase-TBC domain containing protein n=1 Tax=Nitzschia inconspicua TaxID=303405 RepID=A0A9K3KUZ4_9STRA|nr:Rab-GTPase-TBC domain containing protein [Nitzschia inconspicua]
MVSMVQSALEIVWEFLVSYWNLILVATGLGDATVRGYYVFDEDDRIKKAARIEKCLQADSVDLWELRELSLSKGGLLDAKFRQKAWPLLVGLTLDDPLPDLRRTSSNSTEEDEELDLKLQIVTTQTSDNASKNEMVGEEKKSEIDVSLDMIRRDVGRSVIFRYGRDVTFETDDNHVTAFKTPTAAAEKLTRVLEGTIQQSDHSSTLYYYQGLHDIAGVILHHMDYQQEKATMILCQICHSHLRDAMRENFGNITWLLSVILEPLVEKVEPRVHYAIQTSQVDLANICLPWVITWFSHDLHDPDIAGRLADAFLSGHPLMPVYFAVALLTHPVLKQELIQSDCDDPSAAFLLIKRMPLALSLGPHTDSIGSVVPIQEVVDDSITIMNQFPPRSLLDLVDPTIYSRHDLLRRVSSISMFKSPPSSSLNSGDFSMKNRPWWHVMSTDDLSTDSLFVRSKLASGVPTLMVASSGAALIQSQSWGSRKHYPKRKKNNSKWKNRIRSIVVGKQKIKKS